MFKAMTDQELHDNYPFFEALGKLSKELRDQGKNSLDAELVGVVASVDRRVLQLEGVEYVSNLVLCGFVDLHPEYMDWMRANAPAEPPSAHNCKTWGAEVGLLEDGCKAMKCEKCGDKWDSHRKVYGCRHPEAA